MIESLITSVKDNLIVNFCVGEFICNFVFRIFVSVKEDLIIHFCVEEFICNFEFRMFVSVIEIRRIKKTGASESEAAQTKARKAETIETKTN